MADFGKDISDSGDGSTPATGASAGSAVAKCLKSLSDYGLAKTCHLIARNLVLLYAEASLRRFDRRYNIETADGIPAAELDTTSTNKAYAEGYYRTPFSVIHRYFSVLPEDLSDFTFLDIGSGKGSILFYACGYNFKKILGVEFAENLHGICARNIQTFKRNDSRCDDVEAVLVDATEYVFPDENLVIFMFNPFKERVLQQVIDNLQRHFETCRKKIFIGYYNPRYGDFLERASFLRPVAPESPVVFVSVHPTWPLGIFESVDG